MSTKNNTFFQLNSEVNIPYVNKLQLYKDKQALQAFLEEQVKANTLQFVNLKEKIEYLLRHDYIEHKFINKYSFFFIERLHNDLRAVGFEFKSFMAAYKFYTQYSMKTNDGQYYLEDYVDRVLFNALYFANGDEQFANDLGLEMIHRRFQLATPSFLNAGLSRRGEFVSCFLLDVADDMNSIGRSINSSLQLSRIGGGVGLNLSNLRESGSPIKGIVGASSGVLPVMKLYEDSFSYSNQLGQRNGAGVVYLSVFHQDILKFLSAKKENADEKVRVKTLSLGVTIPDKFYELVKNNSIMYLFSSYSVERVYGIPFSYVDISAEYENMVNNPNIGKKQIMARDLENEISKLQQESGYPYVVNIDTVNKASPIAGKIIMSNLCSEILQVQEPSIINEDQSYEKLGVDISCNLGACNITNLMQSNNFGKSVRTMIKALTCVTDGSNIKAVPTVAYGNKLSHSIGLGAMGMHEFLARNEIHYGSVESIEFTHAFFMLINYWSLVESNNIAKERNRSFNNFKLSKYYTGEYFDKYLAESYHPTSDKIKKLFANIFLPSKQDWLELKSAVKEYGLYHQNRLAVAPTGSISYINDTTSSLHPIVKLIEERQEKKIGKVYYPAPALNDITMPYYVSAYDTDMRKVIDLYAAATEHVDQGLSLTLFLRSEIPMGMYEWKTHTKQTTRDLSILRNYAYHKGIKSLYYVRTFTDDNSDNAMHSCEGCMI